MKLLFQVLLLVVMFALQKSQEAEIELTTDLPTTDLLSTTDLLLSTEYEFYSETTEPEDESVENIAVFDITVYRQMDMEDREHDDRVIVVCMFDRMFEWGHSWWIQPFDLSVESELNYTKKIVDCTSSDTKITCVYMLTVSPPATFTCEREVNMNEDFKMRTQTYTYKRSVVDHHEERVSSFYIGFSSFIAVGLFIMTVAVIVTTIRSKAKDSIINPTTTVTDNDYMDA